MHVENQSQQVSIRFNPVAPIAPGHCFYFIIFMNQIYQRALLETTSCQYLMQKNLLGAGFVREIQGSADLQRLEMTHRYGYGSKATLLNIQNIGPYWAHMLHHFFNIYHPIPTSIYIYAIYIYIYVISIIFWHFLASHLIHRLLSEGHQTKQPCSHADVFGHGKSHHSMHDALFRFAQFTILFANH